MSDPASAIPAAGNDEQQAILESARAFARGLRAAMRRTESGGVPAELVSQWRKLEFLRMDWPSARGGFGLGRAHKAMALEALAFGDAAAALALDRASWMCSPLLAVEAVADRIAREIDARGEDDAPAVFADTAHRLAFVGGRVRGTIPWLTATGVKSIFVLQERRLFHLVSGLRSKAVAVGALHALGACAVELDSAPEWEIELSAESARRLRGAWRLYLAAVLVGLAEAASQQTREFCLERVTFGRKLAHHQAVAFLIADMEIAVEAARALVRDEAQALDDAPGTIAGHSAFLQACECALFVTNYAVQLHGSHGYVEDYPVEKWMREARAISLLHGGADGARADLNDALAQALAGGQP